MSYAHPEVLVNTEWLSQNPPNANRKLVEVDYDPVNGYQKGHINGASLIWWKRDINDPVTRDIISKKEFEALMSKNGITADTEVILYGDFNNWFAAFVFWVFKIYGHENLKIMDGGRKKWELECTHEGNIMSKLQLPSLDCLYLQILKDKHHQVTSEQTQAKPGAALHTPPSLIE